MSLLTAIPIWLGTALPLINVRFPDPIKAMRKSCPVEYFLMKDEEYNIILFLKHEYNIDNPSDAVLEGFKKGLSLRKLLKLQNGKQPNNIVNFIGNTLDTVNDIVFKAFKRESVRTYT